MDLNGQDNQAIIDPQRGKGEPNLGVDALMVMIPPELDYLVNLARAQEMPFNESSMYRLYKAGGDVGDFTLAGPFLGAPAAVMAMEKLIVLGTRRIWVLGWCGSLQPGLRVGQLVIPSTAISEEGTSGHYPVAKQQCESDQGLNRMLRTALDQEGLAFSEGPVWTTDAVYRETKEKVKRYQAQGVLAVEMEISALMTVACYRSVKLAALLTVSDELFDLRWRRGFSNPSLKKTSHAAGKALLDLVASLNDDESEEWNRSKMK